MGWTLAPSLQRALACIEPLCIDIFVFATGPPSNSMLFGRLIKKYS